MNVSFLVFLFAIHSIFKDRLGFSVKALSLDYSTDSSSIKGKLATIHVLSPSRRIFSIILALVKLPEGNR
jgi:hypothetical protein|tara:strand:- start:388 stop:597 length:210 start_codon:yes stop_codon:yes gene_type:complete